MALSPYEVVLTWVGFTGSAGEVFVLFFLLPRGLSRWSRDSQKIRKARVDLGPRVCSGLFTGQLRSDDL